MKLISRTFLPLSVLFLCLQNLFSLQPGVFYTDGDRTQKVMALSFDDGPGPWTLKILEILEKEEIKATFFMSGEMVKRSTTIAKAVFDSGHEIANHTYSHINFYQYEKKQGSDQVELKIREEIEKTESILKKVTGVKPKLLRMPNGYYRKYLRDIAKDMDYALVNWSFGEDWKKIKLPLMTKHYLQRVQKGSILLFHDGGKNRTKTLEILPKVIEKAKKNGLKILPVGKILNP